LIAWTHHRIVSLGAHRLHPQLTEPLKYLEISAQIQVEMTTLNDNDDNEEANAVQSVCDAIVESLLQIL